MIVDLGVVTLSPNPGLVFGLSSVGRPVGGRVAVEPSAWQAGDGSLSVRVEFGPFPGRVVFDEVVVWRDGAEVSRLAARSDGSVQDLAVGQVFSWVHTETAAVVADA